MLACGNGRFSAEAARKLLDCPTIDVNAVDKVIIASINIMTHSLIKVSYFRMSGTDR